MARTLLAPFAVRPRRATALLLPTLVLALTVGCGHHKRTSLRPVYVTPSAPVGSAPCPSGDCSGTVSPGGATSSSSVDTSVIESGATGSGSLLPEAPVTSTPMTSPRSSDTPPPVIGPNP